MSARTTTSPKATPRARAAASQDLFQPHSPSVAPRSWEGERQEGWFRLFASLVYFLFFITCTFFVFRNCESLLPGSGRASRALCPAANKVADHFPILGSLWDKISTDVFPIHRRQEENVFWYLSRITTFFLGPLSLLLSYTFLKGWPKRRLVALHSWGWSSFAAAIAVLVEVEHSNSPNWADISHIVKAVLAFFFLFSGTAALSSIDIHRGGRVGTMLRAISLISFVTLIGIIYEFAVDYVPHARGAPSLADAIKRNPLYETGAGIHSSAAAHLQNAIQAGNDGFDTVAEYGAEGASMAAPYVHSALDAATEKTSQLAEQGRMWLNKNVFKVDANTPERTGGAANAAAAYAEKAARQREAEAEQQRKAAEAAEAAKQREAEAAAEQRRQEAARHAQAEADAAAAERSRQQAEQEQEAHHHHQ